MAISDRSDAKPFNWFDDCEIDWWKIGFDIWAVMPLVVVVLDAMPVIRQMMLKILCDELRK